MEIPNAPYAQRLKAKQHLPLEPKFVFDGFLNKYVANLVNGNDVADTMRLPRSLDIEFLEFYTKLEKVNRTVMMNTGR